MELHPVHVWIKGTGSQVGFTGAFRYVKWNDITEAVLIRVVASSVLATATNMFEGE